MFAKFVKLKNSKKGFTLIELMVVVALVAILAAVAIPSYLSYRRESQMEVARTSLAAVVDSMNSYLAINGGQISVVDDSGNITGTVQNAIDDLASKGMDVSVDSIKLDAPLTDYCYMHGKHFLIKGDVDIDTWVALYDDGDPYQSA